MPDYIVVQGIGGKCWFTAELKPNGSKRRVKSDQLPLRDTRAEAEADLRRWLWVKNTTPTQRRQEGIEEWYAKHPEMEGN